MIKADYQRDLQEQKQAERKLGYAIAGCCVSLAWIKAGLDERVNDWLDIGLA